MKYNVTAQSVCRFTLTFTIPAWAAAFPQFSDYSINTQNTHTHAHSLTHSHKGLPCQQTRRQLGGPGDWPLTANLRATRAASGGTPGVCVCAMTSSLCPCPQSSVTVLSFGRLKVTPYTHTSTHTLTHSSWAPPTPAQIQASLTPPGAVQTERSNC